MTPHSHHAHGSHAAAPGAGAACCATAAASPVPHAHASHASHGWRAASSVTLHCLTGCAIGEWIGLAIGTSLALPPTVIVALAVVLSFISGFALTLIPLLRRGLKFGEAMRIVWVGEAISIAVMELVMNLVDYHMGGMQSGGLLSLRYWTAFALALVAGYAAAVPVNFWLLERNLKKCH